jgi:hypothetical protein
MMVSGGANRNRNGSPPGKHSGGIASSAAHDLSPAAAIEAGIDRISSDSQSSIISTPDVSKMLKPTFPDNLPPEMFTGPGLLALADLLPVMTAYYDADVKIQFINKLFADWLDRPRTRIVGKTMAEIIGEEAWKDRQPMVEAALQGERQFFVLELDHPTRGLLSAQTEYVPWT